MFKDLKYAARMLLRTKGWTSVVLVSLALGIGANTALFSAVNGLLLQSIRVPAPETLVRLKWMGKNDMVRSSSEYGFSQPHGGQNVRATMSFELFQQLRSANQTLTDLVACAPLSTFNVIVGGAAEIASGFAVSGNYFNVLRVPAFKGRMLAEADDVASAPPVAVISHAYWRRRFAEDPNIVGRVVTVNNTQITIVGVTPQAFTGVQRLDATAPDVTVPLVLDSPLGVNQTRMSQPTYWWLQVLGRLKPGVTTDQVRDNLAGVFQATARAGMASYMSALTPEQRALSTNQRATSDVPQLVVSSASRGVYDMDQSVTGPASILSVVVVIVLLIVCANVTNLLLSRATSRQKEISVRLSIGATRYRLVRQLLTESLLLSFLGGALGLIVGYWSRQLLPFGQTAPIDWRVLAFAGAVTVVTGITFGLVPAFRATHVDLAGALKEQGRSVTGSRNWLSRGLLVVQVALSLVLLIGAGLFLRTLQNLRSVDVGFNVNNLLMFRVNPQLNRYDADRTVQLYRQMRDALAAVPGVRSVGLTRTALLSGSTSTTSLFVQGKTGDNSVHVMTVSPEFFGTMEIPVVRGRGFTDRDVTGSPRVVIINETAARTYFPGEDAIGRRVGSSIETSGESEVIGVIRDTKYSSLRDAAPPTMYRCYLQNAGGAMAFVLRTAGDPATLMDTVRTTVRQVDANLPLTNVTTQIEQVESRFAQERLLALAYSLFGGLALLLACIGLFGLMSYNVSRRTNEIGIRMALGAQRLDVVRMVLGESLLLVVVGIAIGLGAAIAAGRLVSSVLFGLTATDITTIAFALMLMLVVSTLAGFLPARRASRVNPIVALRYE